MSIFAAESVVNGRVADSIAQRVFLVGCPRSGTTLLQTMLSAHPLIKSFPETHFFDRLLKLEGRTSLREKPKWAYRQRTQALMSDLLTALGWVKPVNADKAWQILRAMPELNDADMSTESTRLRVHVEAFMNALDTMTLRSGADIWIEKTPDHLHFVELISKFIPDAKFVHIIRNGADTVASLYDAAQKYPAVWSDVSSAENAVKRWNASLAGSMRYRGNPHHHFVLYENLVKEPEGTLRNICEFLDCDYDNRMVNDYSQEAATLVQSNEPWKADNFSGIRATGNTKFVAIFDQQQQQYILKTLKQWPE
ncbi:MAG: sulfotransferase [Pseudomonadota bacterium]